MQDDIRGGVDLDVWYGASPRNRSANGVRPVRRAEDEHLPHRRPRDRRSGAVEDLGRGQEERRPGIVELAGEFVGRREGVDRGHDPAEGGGRQQRDGELRATRRVDPEDVALGEAPRGETGRDRPRRLRQCAVGERLPG